MAREPAEAKTKSVSEEEGSGGTSLLRRFEGIWNRTRVTSVACFDCGATQELNSAATSTICPSCSVHMDLRDYKINGSFSRSIRTHGEVHITSGGDLNSSSVICRRAIIDGKLRGSLHCVERAEFRAPGKVQGKLTAPEVLIGKKANVQFFRQLHVGAIEIRGAMSGEIVAETTVTIRSAGSLEGNVVARSINVEKGGRFSGQLVIGRQSLEQAELIPYLASSTPPTRPIRPPEHLFGLPATS
ncbi:MAG TPA: polymer-forming cytoskeletal protein [Chthoniobacterales bacterium]